MKHIVNFLFVFIIGYFVSNGTLWAAADSTVVATPSTVIKTPFLLQQGLATGSFQGSNPTIAITTLNRLCPPGFTPMAIVTPTESALLGTNQSLQTFRVENPYVSISSGNNYLVSATLISADLYGGGSVAFVQLLWSVNCVPI